MNPETILAGLLRVNGVASVAILLVLLLRPVLLRWLGARVAWWLWLVVPAALGAGLIPAREQVVAAGQPAALEIAAGDVAPPIEPQTTNSVSAPATATSLLTLPALADAMVALWLFGAATLLAQSIIRTHRLAQDPSVGPALVGVLQPRLLLPADFATRFDAEERALILAHEEFHRISGHPVINALVEVARCANWFNPLMHLAASRIRADQELACDAAVIAARPTAQRVYAQALLKTQIMPAFLPLGCTGTSRSGELLAQRIMLLSQPALSRRAAIIGTTLIAIVGLASGYAAWAQQPARVVTQVAETPQAMWTPAAEAPAGTLSHALEGQRHDLFIEHAQKGDIDFVLFGTTDAEMFWWPDRGRPVWDQAFATRKAANFGAQGTQARSLLWRMQNGELDGYQAKLIALQASFCFSNGAAVAGGASDDRAVVGANCAPIIAEIRARQPQAKILITPPFPRGTHNRDQWREIASANVAAFAPLVDAETVFYADFGERFFLADGTHNPLMWSRPGIGGTGVGIQPAAFDAWAEELQPWLDRFVR